VAPAIAFNEPIAPMVATKKPLQGPGVYLVFSGERDEALYRSLERSAIDNRRTLQDHMMYLLEQGITSCR
jgi:hypothetical protein